MFRRKNDVLLKTAFEESFPDFLRFYLPDADSIFNMEKGFEFLDKELQEITPEIQNPGGTRFADLLAKTWLRSGAEEWILVHIEIQGTDDANFARRMFTYYYRALDCFDVPITAFAVFTGGKTQKQPAVYQRNFLGTKLMYEYNAYHILDHTEAELLVMNNAFALVVLAAQKVLLTGKIPEKELGEQRWVIAKAFLGSGKYSKEKMLYFMVFLRNFVQVDSSEINAIFDDRVRLQTNNVVNMNMIEAVTYVAREKGIEEGIEKGIEKGRQETKEAVVINGIVELGLADEQIAKIAEVDITFVQRIRQRLERNDIA